jgi:hypothetical protein
MPKVQAWQCPHSKKLFPLEDEKKYRAHVNKQYRIKKQRELLQRKRDQFYDWFATETEELSTPYEIIKWVEKNLDYFLDLEGRRDRWHQTKFPKDFQTILDLNNLRYSDSCSNSHSCPRSGKTNWCGRESDKGVPRGYPGFTGNIYLLSNKKDYYIDTDLLKRIGICTGSGSGGQRGNYTVTIWLDDWPGLKRNVEAQRKEWEDNEIINRLKGTPQPKFCPDIGPQPERKEWWPDW